MASSSAAAAAAPPAFAAPATNEAPLIRVLNPHDVLVRMIKIVVVYSAARNKDISLFCHFRQLGRGLGPSKFEGNVKFRAVVATRKTDYNATDSYNEKARIGKEVFDVINGRGGRFLKLVRTENNVAGKPPRDVVQRGVWKEATRKCALEKYVNMVPSSCRHDILLMQALLHLFLRIGASSRCVKSISHRQRPLK